MSRRRVTVCLIAFLGLVALIPASMWAQAYSSSLTGLVTDPSGAAVPAANVKLTSEQRVRKVPAACTPARDVPPYGHGVRL